MRILVADHHEVVRKGIRAVLETQPAWEIVAEAARGQDAVAEASRLKPDIVILDIQMPDPNGLEAMAQIVARAPRAAVLAYTFTASEQLVRDAIAAGARGYVLKSDPAEALVLAVKALAAGKPYFSAAVVETAFQKDLAAFPGAHFPAAVADLTKREREIVQAVARGASTKEIARQLNISPRTVETHRANIMKKLNISSTTELVRYAIRHRIITP